MWRTRLVCKLVLFAIIAVPTGFVVVAKPTEQEISIGNWSYTTWDLAITPDGGLTITETKNTEPNTGPKLPFALPKTRSVARRHVMEFTDGFLVGFDKGEWGGSLDFYEKNGKLVATLATTNTHAVLRIGEGIVSLHGLNHLSLREGSVRFWKRDKEKFVPAGEQELDAGPECFTLSGNVLWVLTARGLWRVSGPQVKRVHEVDTSMLYPQSLVVDRNGDVWAGMRHFVLHFKKHGESFDEEWLVSKGQPSPKVGR